MLQFLNSLVRKASLRMWPLKKNLKEVKGRLLREVVQAEGMAVLGPVGACLVHCGNPKGSQREIRPKR